ncbi:dethiobiotin synthase [uncultured Duncaniella sp.]|uniref:dethiobiotin synthase n=1 Tax=uncultured Duncaniella sp. TaxID=2768039 RepID=UPI0025D681CC|nr:dethiobiotin synthase [uncultured Duncaniella sp.]
MGQAYFISGIDTDAGKSYVTGYIASRLMKEGKRVATQKFIQTGNTGFSEDIDLHRKIMGIDPLPEDIDHTTAPIIFSYPASAQLAARMDEREIDLDIIDRSTSTLCERYDIVLVEGAGGLMVPITDDFFTIDYVESRKLPIILVTNGVLGSINHTILSLEAIKSRGITLAAVVYNEHFDNDRIIGADTQAFLRRYVGRHFPSARFATIPTLD